MFNLYILVLNVWWLSLVGLVDFFIIRRPKGFLVLSVVFLIFFKFIMCFRARIVLGLGTECGGVGMWRDFLWSEYWLFFGGGLVLYLFFLGVGRLFWFGISVLDLVVRFVGFFFGLSHIYLHWSKLRWVVYIFVWFGFLWWVVSLSVKVWVGEKTEWKDSGSRLTRGSQFEIFSINLTEM